jgi:hypothetical protein
MLCIGKHVKNCTVRCIFDHVDEIVRVSTKTDFFPQNKKEIICVYSTCFNIRVIR